MNLKNIFTKALAVVGFILLFFTKVIGHGHIPTNSNTSHSYDVETVVLSAKLSDAVKIDDWNLVQKLYKQCKIEMKDGFNYWVPQSCKPIILIENSIKAKARKVYHGIANDPQFNLPSNWRENEEGNFKN